MTGLLIRRGNLDRNTYRGKMMKMQGKDDHLQAKEKGLEQILPSWSSEESHLLDLGLLASRTIRK